MLRLLAADLYRVLKDKRVFVIIAFHFALFVLNLTKFCTFPFIDYIGGDVVFRYRMIDIVKPETMALIYYLGTVDLLIATMVYAMFFFADDTRDKTFENMCTIYKSKSLVFITNYITLCITSLGFAVAKMLGVSLVALVYGIDITIFDGIYNCIGVVTWLLATATFIAVFYTAYIIFRNIYVPIVMLFGPLTVTFSPRFMDVLPFGDKLFKYCLLYLSMPSLGFDVTEWDLAFKWIVPLAAVTVVSLVISSVILEKRDVR
ncbi:hypothetical protein SAMN06296952_1876 [Oscillospiraceae bacterium]|nr:hypothetical protein SAMN06296952_1876 [Oscillospiraceae bacterium]